MIKLWTAIKILAEQFGIRIPTLPKAWIVAFCLGLGCSVVPGTFFTKFVSGIVQKWSYNQGRKDGRQECKEAAPDEEKDGRWFRFFAREEQPSGMTGFFIEDHVEVEPSPPEIIDHPPVSEGETLEGPR